MYDYLNSPIKINLKPDASLFTQYNIRDNFGNKTVFKKIENEDYIVFYATCYKLVKMGWKIRTDISGSDILINKNNITLRIHIRSYVLGYKNAFSKICKKPMELMSYYCHDTDKVDEGDYVILNNPKLKDIFYIIPYNVVVESLLSCYGKSAGFTIWFTMLKLDYNIF